MNEENKIPELKDEELEKVTGGLHLTSSQAKGLKYGDLLVIEDALGLNLGECISLGEYRDPGGIYALEILVKITDVYDPSGTFTLDGISYRVGNEAWLSRIDVDFPWRA